MVSFSSKYRSKELEVMDDMNFQGAEMKLLLKDLKTVNTLLGGTHITLSGIQDLLDGRNKITEPLVIVDLGCGDGEILRQCSRWALKKGLEMTGIGVDANPFILEEAQKRSSGYSNLEFKKIDVFSGMDSLPEFDIALCTLFLHHFEEEEIIGLLQKLQQRSKVGIVVNDLERSAWAFRLFRIFGAVFLKTDTARNDGLISVAKGFKKKELQHLSQEISGTHRIRWKWAFRYQWLISNT
ncbi:methyltransferase domain-containing protein [Aureisphaera galaxeae]|uniref:methyltransferase domain-containing protein n=1 Tax=Aureisphaera galaxeae TaxID=1538023 RepID=UPI002350B0DD|nr:methyltransferase domain-containing protein [Aureisphaera galaxeae]MDC8004221.1 methyltransferase domain-containing protein [Aureisphaera galaxeae]